jgi:hypothetical protein
MKDRVGEYLERGIDRGMLTPRERAEAERIEDVIDRARALMDAGPVPDVSDTVLRRIREAGLTPVEISWFQRVVDQVWSPRELTLLIRPVYAAALVLVGLAVLSAAVASWRGSSPPAVAAASAPPLFVQFRLEAAGVSSVRLAGSFTNWQPQYELQQTAPGVWTLTVPLSFGVHDYAFVLDDARWIADPYAPHVDDGFGGTNSRLALLPPELPQS